MKPKHLKARIQQCLAISECSNCPRRKFGAVLVDPKRNMVLLDAYNGGPRGGGALCGGTWCHRDGLGTEDVKIHGVPGGHYSVGIKGGTPRGMEKEEAEQFKAELLAKYPPIKSGTHMEVGCHHAESNLICNAAARGVACADAWLIVTGEPCMMCSKLIHHAGIVKVLVVEGGYIGANGVEYLRKHGVKVEAVGGPKDPRAEIAGVQ